MCTVIISDVSTCFFFLGAFFLISSVVILIYLGVSLLFDSFGPYRQVNLCQVICTVLLTDLNFDHFYDLLVIVQISVCQTIMNVFCHKALFGRVKILLKVVVGRGRVVKMYYMEEGKGFCYMQYLGGGKLLLHMVGNGLVRKQQRVCLIV